ncbi:MAG: hypothetical protein JWR33_2353 [Naasia sp.]|uniref:TspO/MBR family protein n=1 Tax=Naasia sp. TaxID=2546198 RepID=UPI0026080B94|nr:TspO/MBR family protein [Naasia sp.]MCU1571612.1 hypothetical protein [Naasia sp.]
MTYSTPSPTDDRLVPSRRGRFERRSVLVLALFLAISFAVAAFGSLTTIASKDGWYADASKVAWTSPGWMFGPVWTVLYVLMAVSAWLVWRHRKFEDVRPALLLYVVQLFVNSLWSPVFFAGYSLIGAASLWIALAVILVLDVCVIATLVTFWPISRTAALLLLPYLAWILYSTTLNLGDAYLNS